MMLEDIARLADRSASGEHVPSLSLAVQVTLPSPARRGAFLEELRATFEDLARRYTAAEDQATASPEETFSFTLACYPKVTREVS